jgi:LytS/YehU family sensor histidine kinase
MNTKQIAFIAIMSAMGTVLSVISLNFAPISITVPGLGVAALDLSHVATFVAAIFGGPIIGASVGLLSGIYAGYYFGFVAGSVGILSVIATPIGKALTGLTSGFLYKKLKISNSPHSATLTIPIVLVSYIPECLFTIAYFLYIVLYFYGTAFTSMIPIVIPKAWIEIALMSFIMAALAGNAGFREFVFRIFTAPNVKKS